MESYQTTYKPWQNNSFHFLDHKIHSLPMPPIQLTYQGTITSEFIFVAMIATIFTHMKIAAGQISSTRAQCVDRKLVEKIRVIHLQEMIKEPDVSCILPLLIKAPTSMFGIWRNFNNIGKFNESISRQKSTGWNTKNHIRFISKRKLLILLD